MYLDLNRGNRHAKRRCNLFVRKTLVCTHEKRRPIDFRQFLQSAKDTVDFAFHLNLPQQTGIAVRNGFVQHPMP